MNIHLHTLCPAPAEQTEVRTLIVPAEEAGKRADAWLTAHTPGLSRSRIQALIRAKHITINGQAFREHRPTRAGDTFTIIIPPCAATELMPEAIPLDVIFEDADMLALNKPAGLVVHPSAGHASGTIVHALLHHCRELAGIGGVQRPGIVHRLDKGTSGILLVAKSDRAHARLSDMFKTRAIKKEYLALVRGNPTPKAGKITAAIARHKTERKKMAVTAQGGRPAVTYYETLETFRTTALLRACPETGRTHQIRVHLAHCGHGIIGDPVYGKHTEKHLPLPAKRPMLHAAAIRLAHPLTGQNLELKAPLPDDFQNMLQILRNEVK